MKNMTIYLAEIMKDSANGIDSIAARDAFDSMEKAEAFMTANNMERSKWGSDSWYSTISCDLDGTITKWEVK